MKHNLVFMLMLLFGVGTVSSQKVEGKLINIVQLTNDNNRYEAASFSPDGNKIAFSNEGYSGLYVMDKDGKNRRMISSAADIGYRYEWSIDSEEILVRDTRWEPAKGRLHAIWSVKLDGTREKLSEDADYLQPASWVYTKDGSKRAKIVDGKAIARPMTKVKSTAQELATVQNRPQFNKSFFLDDSKLYIVDGNGTKKLISDNEALMPSFSPDGKKIVYNQMDDICIMNSDGSGKKVIGRGFFPSWVNNNQLVFEVTTDDGHKYLSGHLFIMDINGNNKKQLTSGNEIYRYPSVSPDGKTLLFVKEKSGQLFSAQLQ